MAMDRNGLGYGIREEGGKYFLYYNIRGFAGETEIPSKDVDVKTKQDPVYDDEGNPTGETTTTEYLRFKDEKTSIDNLLKDINSTTIKSAEYKTWICGSHGVSADDMTIYDTQDVLKTALSISEEEEVDDKGETKPISELVDKPIIGLPDGRIMVDKTAKKKTAQVAKL